jgi:hypothetical protein
MTRQKLVNCSTVTQAVYDAFWPLGMYPEDIDADNLALALRVVADQVVPQALCVYNPESISIRSQLLAIANELEAQ